MFHASLLVSLKYLIFMQLIMFCAPFFQGWALPTSNSYWHCNKLKPEPRCSWSIMAKGRRFLYLFSESFAPTLLMCHLRWNHLLDQILLDLSPEERHSLILISVIFKKEHPTNKIKEAFKLPFANRGKKKKYCLAVHLFFLNWIVS